MARLLGVPNAGRNLATLLAASTAFSGWLVRNPDWLSLFEDPTALRHGRRREGLERELRERFDAPLALGERARALDGLHEFRQRELLRIAARDLTRAGSLEEVLEEFSNAADAALSALLRLVWTELTERWGTPWHRGPDAAWHPTGFATLGLGKLGGSELNPASDVDLLFVYADEGATFRTPPGTRRRTPEVLPNHRFFQRVVEALVREATRRGAEGGGLRVDLRLRPEGNAGPLARSVAAYENFYASWGQSWERLMLLKARCVAGDASTAGEFQEVIEPFRHPRSLAEGILSEMAAVKARTESESVAPGELDRHLKLGRGGIREIEFVVQVLQVLRGGQNPFLRTPNTLLALPALARYRILPPATATHLDRAYRTLREIENRLQYEALAQTHSLPPDRAALDRLARLSGSPDAPRLLAALRVHTRRVRRIFTRTLGAAPPRKSRRPFPAFPPDFQRLEPWRGLLTRHGFADPEHATRLVRGLVEGPGYGHVSNRTSGLAQTILRQILDHCTPSLERPRHGGPWVLSDPDRVLARLDRFIHAYGPRASLYELWTARPIVLEHLLRLFDRSEFLAEIAIATPGLVDDLEAGNHLVHRKSANETFAELQLGRQDRDQRVWLRRYFRTECVRIGLRHALGRIDEEGASAEWTALAEACLRHAVAVASRRRGFAAAPFAVIGLGRLGGGELDYGSDLDVLFVTADGIRRPHRLQPLAAEVLDLLTSRTELGQVFRLDARLRPDGEKGLLVNTLQAHEEYYRTRAQLWEIQALTRARAVAGDPAPGTAFEALARQLTRFSPPPQRLAAFTPDWLHAIDAMRRRIETQRTPPGREALAFKTGAGGLIDVEFVAQALSMRGGWFEPNTERSLLQAGRTGALPVRLARRLALDYRLLRRMESLLRRGSFEGESLLPEDPTEFRRVALRCGSRDPGRFLEDLAQCRARIRGIYRRVFPVDTDGAAGGDGSVGVA